jgi:hypothetical protein
VIWFVLCGLGHTVSLGLPTPTPSLVCMHVGKGVSQGYAFVLADCCEFLVGCCLAVGCRLTLVLISSCLSREFDLQSACNFSLNPFSRNTLEVKTKLAISSLGRRRHIGPR